MTSVQICQHRIIHTQHSLSPYLTHTDTEHFNRGVSLTVFLWNKQIREISEQTMMTHELTRGYTQDSHSRILSTVHFKTQVRIFQNLVSYLIRTYVHILARHEICTNNYILLQFQKETNTRGSTTLTPFTPFHTNLQSWLIKRNFDPSCYNFKTILKSWEIGKLMLLNVSITHIQLHIYGFS